VGNVYLETREPWRTVKVDRDRTACTLRTAIDLVALIAVASEPWVPAAVGRLRGTFPDLDWSALVLGPGLCERPLVAPGDRIAPPGLLFQKLAPEQLEEWSVAFGGVQDGVA
jgi:methionyl-tRNA synthetase